MQRRRITTHRKSIRKTPPNSPGGICNALSVVADIGEFEEDQIGVQVQIAAGSSGGFGFQNTDVIGGEIENLEGWYVFNAGAISILSVTVTPATGFISITLNDEPAGFLRLIIPPFVPELRSITGILCAGCIITHTY